MKLTQLASKPTLIRVEIDDEEIRKEYDDSLEFWIWDRQPIEDFIKIATAKHDDFGAMVRLINELVLDENGQAVIQDGYTLPSTIMIKVINAVIDRLGK
jgi:hypothetical protein